MSYGDVIKWWWNDFASLYKCLQRCIYRYIYKYILFTIRYIPSSTGRTVICSTAAHCCGIFQHKTTQHDTVLTTAVIRSIYVYINIYIHENQIEYKPIYRITTTSHNKYQHTQQYSTHTQSSISFRYRVQTYIRMEGMRSFCIATITTTTTTATTTTTITTFCQRR